MAKKEIDIELVLNGSQAASSITDIKQQIKALNSESLKVGESTKKFSDLQAKVGELKEKMEDLSDASKSLRGTGIEKLNSSFGLLRDSFANADFGKAKIAFKGLGTAMKAVPIFLLVEGLQFLNEKFGFLTAIMDLVISGINAFTDAIGLSNHAAQEAAQKTVESFQEIGDAASKASDRQIKETKAVGKSTVEVEKQKQIAIIATNLMIQKQLEATGDLTDEQKKQLKEVKENILDAQSEIRSIDNAESKRKTDEDKKKQEDNKKKQAEDRENYKKHQAEVKAADDKVQAEKGKRLQDNINAVNANQKAELDIKDKYAIDTDEIDRRYAEIQSKRKDLTQSEVYQKLQQSLADEKSARDKAQVDQIDSMNKIAAYNKSVMDRNAKAEMTIEGLKNDEIQKNNQISIEDKLKSQEEYLEKQRQVEIDNEELTGKEIEAINLKYANQKKELEQKARVDRINKDAESAKSIVTAVSAINDLANVFEKNRLKKGEKLDEETKKRQFNRSKALSVVSAGISTAQGVMAALAIQNYPGAILTGITGAAQITAILAAKYEPDSGSAGGSAGGSAPSTPSGSLGSDGGQSIQANQLVNIGQPTLFREIGQKDNTIKVVVTDKDIKDVSNKVNVIEDRSKINLGH